MKRFAVSMIVVFVMCMDASSSKAQTFGAFAPPGGSRPPNITNYGYGRLSLLRDRYRPPAPAVAPTFPAAAPLPSPAAPPPVIGPPIAAPPATFGPFTAPPVTAPPVTAPPTPAPYSYPVVPAPVYPQPVCPQPVCPAPVCPEIVCPPPAPCCVPSWEPACPSEPVCVETVPCDEGWVAGGCGPPTWAPADDCCGP
jgi:hypothetical protein